MEPRLKYHCDSTGTLACTCAVSEAVVNWLRIVATSPHAPYNVTVITSFTSAIVSWLPGYDGGHPLHYVLWSVNRLAFHFILPVRLEASRPSV